MKGTILPPISSALPSTRYRSSSVAAVAVFVVGDIAVPPRVAPAHDSSSAENCADRAEHNTAGNEEGCLGRAASEYGLLSGRVGPPDTTFVGARQDSAR